jgi:hypothetical protein
MSLEENVVFWDVTSCSPLKVNRPFGGIYRTQLQSPTRRARYWHECRGRLVPEYSIDSS